MTRILLATSNGTGLGHLTRCMAIARRLPGQVQPVLLTLSQALPVAVAERFHCEFLPSYDYGMLSVHERDWNRLLERRLRHLVELYEPHVVVFDAVSGYRGLLDAADALSDTPFVWLRRGMWKRGMGAEQLRHERHFRAVLEPGDYAGDADRGPTVVSRDRTHLVAPIVYLDPDQLLDAADARSVLGLDPGRISVLIQLGSGAVEFVDSTAGQIASFLLDRGVQVTVAESVIAGQRMELPPGVHRARVYPLAELTRAFDFAVAAPGYNLFHEALAFGLPSLLLPKPDAGRDDQTARAAWAAATGMALTCDPGDRPGREAALTRLLDPGVRAELRSAMSTLPPAVGGRQAAAWLAGLTGAPATTGGDAGVVDG